MARRLLPIDRAETTIDGISYTISVYRARGGFHASWLCGGCGETGASSLTRPTKEEAISRARLNLSEHHGHKHPPSR
jgi:hypothetical protein